MGTCPQCGVANPDRARFCQECGTALPSTADENQVRKVVTVLFTDVVGSTALAERLDAEAVRGVMARYFDLARDAAESHGGTVEKFIGDAVMAVFGIPQLHEDDAIRAIRAAAEIRRSLRELNLDLEERYGVHFETRTGINTGEVIAGYGGGQTLVTGDAVNTAARLEQSAEPGAIVIGELTYRLARDWITATRLEPLAAKGKAEPVAAYMVERVTSVTQEAVSPVGRLVGREQELADLLGQFDRVVRTRGVSLVTLLAQPGVGKSRILRELLTRLPSATKVIQGRCIPYGEAARYWPIREALRNAASIADGDSAELMVEKISALAVGDPQARAIGEGVASLIGVAAVSASQDEGFWAARRLLERVAQAAPIVAVFEDLHWADATFLDLLEYVADLASDAPILLLTTARPELLEWRPGWGAGRANAHVVRLEPLTEVDIRTLCRAQDDADALPDALVDRIVRSAEGNPLYVEQIVAMLREDGAGMTDPGVPPTIRALIASRLDRLPGDARRVAERASVIGRVFETSALAHVAPSRLGASVTQHLLTLVRREFIRPTRADLGAGDAYAFRHALIRDAAYEALPKRERAEIHERLADWLEEHVGPDLSQYQELIAHHLEQATRYRASLGDPAAGLIARRAADHLAQVGGRSLAGGAVRHAAAVLRRSMDLAGDTPPAELLLNAGDAITRAGDHEGQALMRSAIERARAIGDRSTEALATAVVAMHEAGGGDLPVDRATSVIEQALATLERDGDPDRLARAYAALFFVQWASARLVDATSTAERAIEYARAAGSEGRARRVTSLLSGLFVEGPMPVPRGIAECGRMLDEVGESPGARYPVLESLGWLHAAADHPADARRCLSEALSIVEEVGQKVDTLYVRMALAETERIGGNLERAEKLATDVVHELAEPDSTTAVLAASLLSRIKAERGDSEAALSLLEALPADPQAALFVRADWLRARALALLQLRRVDDALRTASDALMVVESTDLIVARGEAQEILGKVELVRGNAAEARRHLEAARDLYRQKDYTVALRNVEAELRT